MSQPTYTPLPEDAATTMFVNTIDKVRRLENFFEVMSRLAIQDKALSGLAIEGLCLCDSTVEELREAYRTMGLDGELIE
jgi:hypothetical protein